jgi:hypothetical protein
MANQEDKGKSEMFDQSDITGKKPYSSIGPDRSTEETKSVVNKLKKKKKAVDVAEGTESTGEASGGKVSTAIGNFVNR